MNNVRVRMQISPVCFSPRGVGESEENNSNSFSSLETKASIVQIQMSLKSDELE